LNNKIADGLGHGTARCIRNSLNRCKTRRI
jgi:hypothetical protein